METIVKTIHKIRLIIVDFVVSGVSIFIFFIFFLILLMVGLFALDEANCMFFDTCSPPPDEDIFYD